MNTSKKIYYCDNKCSTNWGKLKWKTEKGYNNHMLNCPNSKEKILEKNRLKEDNIKKQEKLQKEAEILFNNWIDINGEKYIGKEVAVLKILNYGTYEQKGSRMEKVRYEDKIVFTPFRLIVKKIILKTVFESVDKIENHITFNSINGVTFGINDIKKSYEEAEKEATRRTNSYKEYCEECSDLR